MRSRGFAWSLNDQQRRGLTLSWLVLFVLSILMQYGALANPRPVDAVHDDGLFELEGNAVDQAAPGDDWQNGTPGAADTLFIPGSVEKDGVDTTYFHQGGSKDHNDLDDWHWSTTDVAPDKDELLDVFAAAYDSPGGTIVYFGADKFDDSGDAQIGFWFFQDDVSLAADGTFNGLHTVGDVLVLSDFTNGGSVDLICVYEWNPPGDDIAAGVPTNTGCDLGDSVTLAAAGAECDVSGPDGAFDICAIVNAGTETAPWPFVNKDGATSFGAGQFFEGGINLDALFGGDAPCFSGFLAETRSSQEVEAQLKDFALGNLDTCGSLTIIKDAVPDDAQDFGFTTTGGLSPSTFSLDDDANATLSNTRVYSQLEDGQYTVTEGATANWQLTNLVCNDANGSVDLATRTATVNLGPGEHVTCTFTNTRYGRIIVEKQTLPDGSSQSFEFDPSWGSNFNLTDGQQNNSGFLAPGEYNVSEVNIPAGWDLTSAVCDQGETVDDIDLGLNETVTCVFTNRQDGQIIVDKVTDPSGSSQQFEFDSNYGANFFLTDAAAPNNSGNLDPGTYSVEELTPAGWDLTGVSCSDGSANTAINLGPGETVTCTFSNRQDGKIIVVKQTTPDGSSQSFEFDPSWGSNFFLTDGQQNDSGFLNPGTYSVAEVNLPAGWDLTSATCSDGSAVNNISLQAGETVTCTFNNRQDGKIIVVKQTTPDGSSQSFEFDPSYGSNFNLTDGQQHDSGFLDPGTYSVAEVNIPAGWDLTSSSCDDGSAVNSISLQAGETVTCTFNNRQDGRIIVVKQTLPDGSTQSFEFDPSYGSNFNLTDGQQNDSGFLDPGEYSVAEVNIPAGWDLTGASCDQGETVDDIDLGPAETVTCTFTNTQRGHIVVDKVTNPSGDSQSFSFDAGGAGYSDFSLTDAAAPNDQEVVPGSYSVSETVPSGWDLTSATCDQGETVEDIDVEPGETVTCTFVNTKRGTIIVEKQTSPDGAEGSFTFTGDAAGSIGDGGQIVVSNLVPGTYTSTEDDPTPEFDLTSILCDDSNSGGDLGTRTATFELDPGETVKCTFTNTQRGTITIIKDAQPNDAQDFGFDINGFDGPIHFELDDDGNATLSNMETFENVPPGEYDVTEAGVEGWDLIGIECVTLGGASAEIDGATANLTMAAGGSITCTYTNAKPSIEVVKTAGDAADGEVLVQGPGQVTYTYVVENTGPVALENIVVTDDNGTPGDPGDDFEAECPKTTLAAGESMTCTFTVTVNENRINEAVVTGQSAQGTPVEDEDDAEVRVPDVEIDKSHDDADGIVFHGQTVTFTLDVEVISGPVTNAVVTDVLPAGQTYVAGSQTSIPAADSFEANGQTLTWTFASLPSGNPAATISYDVTIDEDASGSLTNEAEVCVDEPGVACDDDDETVDVPELPIDKSFTGNTGGTASNGIQIATITDTLTYTLAYDLTGGPVHNGVITDELPVGLTYVTGSATGNDEFDFVDYDEATRTLTWHAEVVSKDGSVTYQVTVDDNAFTLPQPLINVASIDSDETDRDEDEDDVLVQTVQQETSPPTLPPTDTLESNDQAAPSNPGFGLTLVLLIIAGIGLVAGYLTPAPARSRRESPRR